MEETEEYGVVELRRGREAMGEERGTKLEVLKEELRRGGAASSEGSWDRDAAEEEERGGETVMLGGSWEKEEEEEEEEEEEAEEEWRREEEGGRGWTRDAEEEGGREVSKEGGLGDGEEEEEEDGGIGDGEEEEEEGCGCGWVRGPNSGTVHENVPSWKAGLMVRLAQMERRSGAVRLVFPRESRRKTRRYGSERPSASLPIRLRAWKTLRSKAMGICAAEEDDGVESAIVVIMTLIFIIVI